jgi:general secretion pathway protein K
MSGRRTERGLALVSVLWGVAILSIVAAAMLTASLTTAYVGRNTWNATRAGSLDEAAINHAILALMDARAPPPVDNSPASFRFAGDTVRVWIQDESGRINLNFASPEVLERLFANAGAPHDRATALAERIVARRTPTDAQGAPKPILFHDVAELLQVDGMTPALYARVAPAFTVYGRDGGINQDAASRQVLLALPGMDDKMVDDRLRMRIAPPPGTQPTAPRAMVNATFTVTAESHVGPARAVRVAVVQFTGDRTKPYWFLSWQ